MQSATSPQGGRSPGKVLANSAGCRFNEFVGLVYNLNEFGLTCIYIYIWAPRVFRAPHICMICTFGLSS